MRRALGLVLGATLAAGTLAAAPASGEDAKPASFAIDIALSPKAAARLAGREGIVVSVYVAGTALPAHYDKADDFDEIDLGSEELTVPGQAGRVTVTGANFKPERLGWVDRESAYVNVNIYTARRSSPDNLISCDPLVTGSIAEVTGQTFAVRCALISEG